MYPGNLLKIIPADLLDTLYEHLQDMVTSLHTVVYLLCLGPVSVCYGVNNNTEKASAGSLTSMDTGCSIVDSTITADRPVSFNNSEQMLCTSLAIDTKLVNHADPHSLGDAACESSVRGAQYADEGGVLQGRVAREPIDRARYVVVNGSSGTVFACSRCSKQYIHRKSLNKHWNDKHADDSIDSGRCLTSGTGSVSEPRKSLLSVALVHAKHPTPNCTTVQSHAVRSPTRSLVPVERSQQQQRSDRHTSPPRHGATIRDSVLWHSLAAIHLNQERDLNSFCCAPMPAHISARASFLNQILYDDDDCQVLDLSKGSRSVHEQPRISVPDTPLDLSVKSNSMRSVGTESLSGCVESISKSAVGYRKETQPVDTPTLNKPRRTGDGVAKFGACMSGSEPLQSDSVAMLRLLHSGVLTGAKNHRVLADSGSDDAIAFNSDESRSNHTEFEPSTKYDCHPNTAHFETSSKMTATVSDDLATSKETHDFFGGISRGGHIRCKSCDFSATSMLLFSQHVAKHARNSNVNSAICDDAQNQWADGVDETENGFFTLLGLCRTAGADSDQKSNDICHHVEVNSLDTDANSKDGCKAAVTDVSEIITQAVQANGFESVGDADSGPQIKSCGSYSVRQKPGRYQRGLGLTTTESRDAVGRSWRRRRLRTCDRCGYVTDNLTTLKRHEVKHGALGMYRCKSCDYTVNQQHILDYHTRSVHGLLGQIGPANSSMFKHTDTPLVDGTADERRGGFTAGDDRHGRLSKGLSDTVSAVQSAAHICSSQAAEIHDIEGAVNKCGMQTVASKTVQHPVSVTAAQRHLLDAFCLQFGRGVCVRCGFRSLSTVRMKQHMLRHPHERHACSLCPHTSPTARLLMTHRRQHADCRTGHFAPKKTYQCPECPFIAASPNRLQCHTQFHGAKFRHVCGECSYSVDRANLIAQHRRLHDASARTSVAGLKRCWLHCSKCPFKTTNRVTLVNHERGHYAINCRYMCGLCSFGTDVANVAVSHQRLHSSVVM